MKMHEAHLETHSLLRAVSHLFTTVAIVLGAVALQAADVPSQVIEEQIQALRSRDDRPLIFLKDHVEQAYPHLVAALDSPKTGVSSNCFVLLKTLPIRPQFTEALVRIATDKAHVLNIPATLVLFRVPMDERVRTILQSAVEDRKRFPDAEDRAHFAETLGQTKRATELLVEAAKGRPFSPHLIGRIADLGENSAVQLLESQTNSAQWSTTAAACLALAKIDPARHALTAAQSNLLYHTGHLGLAGGDSARQKVLSALPQAEIRPFVLQMLLCEDRAAEAAGLLRFWKDKEALPQMRKALEGRNGLGMIELLAAYIEIEGGGVSVREVAEWTHRQVDAKESSARNNHLAEILDRFAQAGLSSEHWAALLPGLRQKFGAQHPELVYAKTKSLVPDFNSVLPLLIEYETNLPELAFLVGQVPPHTNDAYTKLLDRAAATAAAQGAAQSQNPSNVLAMLLVLKACGEESTPIGQPLVETLMKSKAPSIRVHAARHGTRFAPMRPRALAMLNAALMDRNADLRFQAVYGLSEIPVETETERLAREKSVLSCLGGPGEDFVFQLLPTCEGAATTSTLSPILNGTNILRAVYAAWLLAQHPDTNIANTASRRLGIYAVFHQHMHHLGSGIDFTFGPGLVFCQRSENFKPGATGPVQIREVFPSRLTQDEAAFLLRIYQQMTFDTPQTRWLALAQWSGWEKVADESYLPFFRLVAREDPCLEILRVGGEKIVSFPNRKIAAQAVARLTQKPATYLGLNGEELDSAAVPEKAYDHQNQLLAQMELDRITASQFNPGKPDKRVWNNLGNNERLIRLVRADSAFGPELKLALLDEARRRGIADSLFKAGFNFWRY